MRIIFFLATLVLTRFTLAQTPTELKAKLPQIAGWTIDDTVEVFDSDNLYDRINGAAPGFILFGFEELTVFEYIQNGDDDHRPYITIQVYRHAGGLFERGPGHHVGRIAVYKRRIMAARHTRGAVAGKRPDEAHV